MTNQTNIAVFIDFENFSRHESFNTKQLIDKLKERGRLIVKKAYADWGRFAKAKRQMLENSVELIELPSHTQSKNSADIKLVVDALETAITKAYIDTIVVVSGDSDYTPLISKLREYNKYVIVVGAEKQVSKLLVGYCDELIYYASLIGEGAVEDSDLDVAYGLLRRTITYLEDQGVESRSSLIKSHMKQLDSSFNESNYGFSQFKHFLEKTRESGLVSLSSLEHGDYLVRLLPKQAAHRPHITAPRPRDSGSDERLLYLIGWAIKIDQFGDRTEFMLSEIASTIKSHLEPAFDLQKYGYPRKKGFKVAIEDLEKRQFVKLGYDDQKNQYYLYPSPRLDTYLETISPPKNFSQLRLESMCTKLGLTPNLNLIGTFIEAATSVLTKEPGKPKPLSLTHLVEACRQRIKEGNNLNRVINTLIMSGVLRTERGHPIREFEETCLVYSIEPRQVALTSCVTTIQEAIKLNFPDDIDAAVADMLDYP